MLKFQNGHGYEKCAPRALLEISNKMMKYDHIILDSEFIKSDIFRISFQFVAFNTEDGYDVVSVYDGANTSAPLIGQ